VILLLHLDIIVNEDFKEFPFRAKYAHSLDVAFHISHITTNMRNVIHSHTQSYTTPSFRWLQFRWLQSFFPFPTNGGNFEGARIASQNTRSAVSESVSDNERPESRPRMDEVSGDALLNIRVGLLRRSAWLSHSPFPSLLTHHQFAA
jgi:hypothetical protein